VLTLGVLLLIAALAGTAMLWLMRSAPRMRLENLSYKAFVALSSGEFDRARATYDLLLNHAGQAETTGVDFKVLCFALLAALNDLQDIPGAADLRRQSLDARGSRGSRQDDLIVISQRLIASEALKRHRYEAAEAIADDALLLAGQSPGVDARTLIDAMVLRARVHLARGELCTAEPVAARCVQLADDVFGEGDIHTVPALRLSADLMRLQDRFEAAEATYRRAIEIVTTHEPTRVGELRALLSPLASMYHRNGSDVKASAAYRQLLKLHTRRGAPPGPAAAEVMAGLAGSLARIGELSEAATLFKQALQICDEMLAADDPRVADILISYAQLQQCIGRQEAACQLARRAIEIVELEGSGRSLPPERAAALARAKIIASGPPSELHRLSS
jgi:tetratricopeptide (TPR) repeat protein